VEFQGTITNKDGSPMGTFESVQEELNRMFPGLVFEWSPSGVKKLAEADARGIELPSIVRRMLEAQPSFLCGELVNGPMSVTINIGSNEPVVCIWVTVSGDGQEAEAALNLFVTRHGWIVNSPEPLQVVRLARGETLQLSGRATLVFDDPQSADAPP